MIVVACPDCGSRMREMRDLAAYSCLGCGGRVTERDLHARERGRIIDVNEPRPVSVPEVYLSALIASERPSLIWGAKEVKRGR